MSTNRFRLLLGRRLRAARVATGFDLIHFAEEIGVSLADYERIESGKDEPDLETLVYAARITSKSLDFLLTGGRPVD